MARRLMAAFAFGILLVAAGCDSAADKDKQGDAPQAADSGLKELEKTDVEVGKGPEAQEGDLVFVIYTGKLKNGKVFDSNDKPTGNPFALRLGAGGVIKGWDEGIPGMRVGGVRQLAIPAKLAYGEASPSPSIPANSDLYFEIELLDMVKKGDENVFEKEDVKVGTGKAAAEGDKVTIHYVMKLVNGRQVDSTYERKKAESFVVGKGDVIKGLEYGVVGMKEGGKRKMRIPPNIGFGPGGLGVLPPDSIALMEVELVKVEKR